MTPDLAQLSRTASGHSAQPDPLTAAQAAPTVSVALCTYNGAQFLPQQLHSIAAQRHPVDELVVCDDGSTDQTVCIVREFAARSHICVRLEQNDRRLGVTKNFEKAVSLCTGSVIFLCDQDDQWNEGKVSTLLKSLDDPAIGLAFSDAQVVDESLTPAGYSLWQSVWFDADEQSRVRRGDAVPVLLRHAVAAGSTLAFRSSYLPLLLPFPDYQNCHDIWITLLLGCVSRICPVPESLMKYRLHQGNTIGLRKHNLIGQIKMARWQVESGAFQYAADLHQAAFDRLGALHCNGDGLPSQKQLLARKVAHARARQNMPKAFLRRLPSIARELRSGNYPRFSYGFKSVLQDLFLR